MMWLLNGLSQALKDVMCEASVHNIILYTVITSSSILSVIGALRHVYTYIFNLKQSREKVKPALTETKVKRRNSDDWPQAQFNNLPYSPLTQLVNCRHGPIHVKSNDIACDFPTKESVRRQLKCLRCDHVGWERFCVHGLCHLCCEQEGWCQDQRHRKQPVSYQPWTASYDTEERVIDLSNMSLYKVPEQLSFDNMDATVLNISTNFLSHLPEHLALIRGLVSMNLSNNLFDYIPTSLGSFHHLTTVDLRQNKCSTLSESVLQLQKLQTLLVDDNQLSFLPCDINKLVALKELGLGFNKLQNIPDSLCDLHGLQLLRFCGNKLLNRLPSAMGRLVYLCTLDVRGCNLYCLPSSLRLCSHLRHILASGNRLQWLPSELSSCFRLEVVKVDNNELTCLPASFLLLQNSLSLKADHNPWLSRTSSSSFWTLLDPWPEGSGHFIPSLRLLTLAVVNRSDLDTSCLPRPLQDELSTLSSCHLCWTQDFARCVRAVCFSPFADSGLELPFLYAFCIHHVQGCPSTHVQTRLDTLANLQRLHKVN